MLKVVAPAPPKAHDVRVLSVMPPWAHLLATGEKPCLTQGTQTLFRGWVAIHVPGLVPVWADDLAMTVPFRHALEACEQPWVRARGCVIGLVRLADCLTRGRGEKLWEGNHLYGDFKPGSWLWQFDKAVPLKTPVPAGGKTGIRELEPAVLDLVAEQAPSVFA